MDDKQQCKIRPQDQAAHSNLESLRVTVPEICPGQNLGRKNEKKKKRKTNEANWMVSNSAQLDCRIKQHTQFGVSASNGSRDMAQTKSWRKKQTNKKNNEANWMVSNSAQLDRRTKQHIQFGVFASNGSRIWPGQCSGKIVAGKKN